MWVANRRTARSGLPTRCRLAACPTTANAECRGVGWFPNARHPHTFWAGVEGGKPLAELARATEQAVARLGVPVETRAYSPHLTLARVKDNVGVEEVAASAGTPDFGAFRASSFFLYLSLNGKYSKLAEFPFNS